MGPPRSPGTFSWLIFMRRIREVLVRFAFIAFRFLNLRLTSRQDPELVLRKCLEAANGDAREPFSAIVHRSSFSASSDVDGSLKAPTLTIGVLSASFRFLAFASPLQLPCVGRLAADARLFDNRWTLSDWSGFSPFVSVRGRTAQGAFLSPLLRVYPAFCVRLPDSSSRPPVRVRRLGNDPPVRLWRPVVV